MKTMYALILCNQQAAFYRRTPQNWLNEPLQGEVSNSVSDSHDMTQLLQLLDKRINLSTQLANIELVVLYAADMIGLLAQLPTQLAQLGCTSWQVLHWEMLLQRAITIKAPQSRENAHNDEVWLVNNLLPLLDNTLNHQDDAWLAERKRAQEAHVESLETLKADRVALENEIAILKQQLKTLQRYDLNELFIFLPVLYRNFWSKNKPSDIALLAGSYDVPQIPSPFPEPDSQTLLVMKQKLQKLPDENRQQLQTFCSQLPANLEIRPEMRFFFES